MPDRKEVGTAKIDHTVPLREESWKVLRTGRVEEVHHGDGRITYRTQIWDVGREPFITVTFNDEGPANSFLERIMLENTHIVNNYDRENGNGE